MSIGYAVLLQDLTGLEGRLIAGASCLFCIEPAFPPPLGLFGSSFSGAPLGLCFTEARAALYDVKRFPMPVSTVNIVHGIYVSNLIVRLGST
jgi:hypothetical protein